MYIVRILAPVMIFISSESAVMHGHLSAVAHLELPPRLHDSSTHSPTFPYPPDDEQIRQNTLDMLSCFLFCIIYAKTLRDVLNDCSLEAANAG